MICSSAIGFDPRVDDRRLTFGFEGIWQGTALLYDHQTESLWMHITGECIRGPHAGTFLAPIDSGRHTTWADWRRTHPQTEVLAEDPALADSGSKHGYFPRAGARSGQAYFPPTFPGTIQDSDARLAPADLVYGVVVGEVARAYPFVQLAGRGIVEERVGDVEVTVWFDRASRSAAAYDRRLDGRTLSFEADDGQPGSVVDKDTRSRWSMEGVCTAGARKGKRLRRVRGLMSEWYGWYASYSQTTILER